MANHETPHPTAADTAGPVPAQKALRNELRDRAVAFVRQHRLAGPVSLARLRQLCQTLIDDAQLNPAHTDFMAICLNNALWQDAVAAVPFDKRLLLLPKCLRHADRCPATFDRFGLLCRGCGRCVIDAITARAKTLGYTILVAEGSPMVMSLIQTGRIQAVIGVSCLSVLEQTFPYMEAGAIAGVAVPLLRDGCVNTEFDLDWLDGYLTDFRSAGFGRVDLSRIRDQVGNLFTPAQLAPFFEPDPSRTAAIAQDWMAQSGKRLRPMIAAAVYRSLSTTAAATDDLPDAVRQAAVAIECFHKASLIHDDIEDGDETRYGRDTLHLQHGVPVALNTGDYLLGVGYRLLAEAPVSEATKVAMLTAAATGHYHLCIGQGNELTWLQNPAPLSVEQVLDIFRNKTAPAFEVALRLGLALSDGPAPADTVITGYCTSLGVAYQILDDIDDFDAAVANSAFGELKPSLLYALACRDATPAQQPLLLRLGDPTAAPADLLAIFADLSVKRKALDMLDACKSAAVEAIEPVTHLPLKSLLRILISKIFHEIDLMNCCDDHPKRHDA